MNAMTPTPENYMQDATREELAAEMRYWRDMYYGSKNFDPMRDIEAFHTKFALEYDGKPRVLPEGMASFRCEFLAEELREYTEGVIGAHLALLDNEGPRQQVALEVNLAHMLDGLIDLTYVALGTAYLHGYDFREGWRRVHHANMQKVRAEDVAESKRNSTLDVIKPEGWTAPDLTDLVSDNAHRVEADVQ